ncbi:hypothetical protein HK405_011019, partial [Cladochytrium tenue]
MATEPARQEGLAADEVVVLATVTAAVAASSAAALDVAVAGPFTTTATTQDGANNTAEALRRRSRLGRHAALATDDSESANGPRPPQFVDIGESRPWRLNLVCWSQLADADVLFVAVVDTLHCYAGFVPGEPRALPAQAAAFARIPPPPRPDGSRDGVEGRASTEHRTDVIGAGDMRVPINAIRGGRLGDDDVLVAVDDDGMVAVHFVAQYGLAAAAGAASATAETTSWAGTPPHGRPPLVLDNGRTSTWGVAVHGATRRVAVSANNMLVRVFDVGAGGPRGHSRSHREFAGHQHNIPSVDFSGDGALLASCSIDGTCRVWAVETGDTVAVLAAGAGQEWSTGLVPGNRGNFAMDEGHATGSELGDSDGHQDADVDDDAEIGSVTAGECRSGDGGLWRMPGAWEELEVCNTAPSVATSTPIRRVVNEGPGEARRWRHRRLRGRRRAGTDHEETQNSVATAYPDIEDDSDDEESDEEESDGVAGVQRLRDTDGVDGESAWPGASAEETGLNTGGGVAEHSDGEDENDEDWGLDSGSSSVDDDDAVSDDTNGDEDDDHNDDHDDDDPGSRSSTFSAASSRASVPPLPPPSPTSPPSTLRTRRPTAGASHSDTTDVLLVTTARGAVLYELRGS